MASSEPTSIDTTAGRRPQNQYYQQLTHQTTSGSNQVNLNPEPLDFDECLKDSPKFRHQLKENLAYIEHMEHCMSKTIKQISNYIETGRDHIKAQKDFINSMMTLNQALTPNSKETSKNVNTLLETLEEIMRLHEIVIDQSARTVGSSLTRFINDDLQKLREARKSFDKISHEYDQALIKYSQPVKKQQEDSENLLIATSTAFTHTSLDLSIQLTSLQSKKGYDILGSLLSFTRAHSTFFHQGFDLFEDLKPHISNMDEHLNGLQDEFETLTRNLPSKHLMVSNNELRPLCFDNGADQIYLEGYLFKRASNGFKVWNRRWFILKNHQLMYQKRGGDIQPIMMEDDLRLLSVRPVDKTDNDRRFCFEVVSPQKSHILQADSEAACKTWISAIQAGINAAFHDAEHKSKPRLYIPNNTTTTYSETPEKPQRAYMIILAMPGNDVCADCGAGQPRWASINLGITLCIECAGIHRSLGVHESKVRSLTLDTEVWSPEIVQLMLSLGNNSVNSAYLACFRDPNPPIDADSSREDRENWIKSKYLLKSFMQSSQVSTSAVAGKDDNNDDDNDNHNSATSNEKQIDDDDKPKDRRMENRTSTEHPNSSCEERASDGGIACHSTVPP